MIETRHLLLRQWIESDTDALYLHASDPQVSQPAQWPCHTSAEMSRMVIRQVFMPNPDCYAMVLRQTGQPVGCIGLVPPGDEHCAMLTGWREVGYWVGRRHWRCGFAAEALTALIASCRQRSDINTLVITTLADNTPSQGVALKCGFTHHCDIPDSDAPIRVYTLPLTPDTTPDDTGNAKN